MTVVMILFWVAGNARLGVLSFSMTDAINTYLKKNAPTDRWPLEGTVLSSGIPSVVVIPALAEYDALFDTLFALSATSATQVIVVVNNSADSSPVDIENNRRTLEALKQCDLAWVDASSPGCELPAKEGVGLARRIGADHGLRLLAQSGNDAAPIVHLDADAPPSPAYLDAIHAFYGAGSRWGGYASYQHPTDPQDQVMIAYENYMRYHELALHYAGSPYAYPALGSIMSSTAHAYASIGGMNRRCAAEDFYFMQQLAKTGALEAIPHTMVYPSSRSSQRTPFGTGRVIEAATPHSLLFHPRSYDVLRCWLGVVTKEIMLSGASLLEWADRIHPELKRFLKQLHFERSWDRIAANHPTPAARLRQFQVWFDGLRTIQLIHHLRDTAFPNVAAGDAIDTLLEWHNTSAGVTPMEQLRAMRRLCREKTLHQS